MKTDNGVSANQRSRARAMRGSPTDAELRLWRLLRDRRLNGLRFRRQVPVGPYIVDFLCIASRLVVEADGSQHAESDHDDVRDTYLRSQGWTVLRFWNCDVLRTRESCSIRLSCMRRGRRGANPHPALRATFSRRGRGAPNPFPLGGKV